MRMGAAQQPTVWVVRAGPNGRHAAEFERSGLVALPFAWVGDLGGKSRDAVRREVMLAEPNEGRAAGHAAMLVRFAREIAVGDFVITPDFPSASILFGRVSGVYQYAPDGPIDGHPHIREVAWVGRNPRNDYTAELLQALGAPMAVFRPAAQHKLLSLPIWRGNEEAVFRPIDGRPHDADSPL